MTLTLNSATDFLSAAFPDTYSSVLEPNEPATNDELANWKLDETPARCELLDGVEGGVGVRAFAFASGDVIVEGPSETAADAGGAR